MVHKAYIITTTDWSNSYYDFTHDVLGNECSDYILECPEFKKNKKICGAKCKQSTLLHEHTSDHLQFIVTGCNAKRLISQRAHRKHL